MNLVDSSGWLEFLAGGSNADFFEKPLSVPADLIVPAVCFSEVFKAALREWGENKAIQAAALISQGRIIDLTPPIALKAARLGLARRLPLAESIIAATAEITRSVIWTQDERLRDMPGVRFVSQRSVSPSSSIDIRFD